MRAQDETRSRREDLDLVALGSAVDTVAIASATYVGRGDARAVHASALIRDKRAGIARLQLEPAVIWVWARKRLAGVAADVRALLPIGKSG